MFLRSRNRTTGEYQSVKLVSPRRARNFSEDRGWREGGVRRKEKFVAKFAAPIVIANIFIPSYSFRFSLSIFFLSFISCEMMTERIVPSLDDDSRILVIARNI